jgi:hypothetical protein
MPPAITNATANANAMLSATEAMSSILARA